MRFIVDTSCRVLLETEGSDAVLEKIDLAGAIGHGRVMKEVSVATFWAPLGQNWGHPRTPNWSENPNIYVP